MISNYDHKVGGSFHRMTTQETSMRPQCTGCVSVVAASGKTIMAFNWRLNCVCGGAKALATKCVVFECTDTCIFCVKGVVKTQQIDFF